MSVYLVRHAHAGDRHRWDDDQDQRPLSDRGRAQADAVASLLSDREIKRVVTSPTTRCAQTVEPLAHRLGLQVEVDPALYEGTGTDDLLALVDRLIGEDVVLCSHGDVIPDLLRALRHRGLDGNGLGACEKGSTWELAVHDGQVASATYHPPVG